MKREIVLVYPDGSERVLGAGSAEGLGRALTRSLAAAMAPAIEAATRSTIAAMVAALGNLAPAPPLAPDPITRRFGAPVIHGGEGELCLS